MLRRFRAHYALHILLIASILGMILPIGCVNRILSHQPLFIQQMKLLVTPDDPDVLKSLDDILNEPLPENNQSYFYLSLDEKFLDFNRIVEWVRSNISNVSDQTAHGVYDYWQLPAETLRLGTGDCEDFAILLCSLIRAYGVPSEDVFVAIGKASNGDEHAWLLEKYSKGVWNVIDRITSVISIAPANYITELCFNDNEGFRGLPTLPSGTFEFELPASYYPLMSESGDENAKVFDGLATQTYYRELKAGQTITATLEWLKYSVYSTYNANILYPWSFYIYDKSGTALFSLNSNDIKHTVDFKAPASGIYEIEVVKQDSLPRCVRLSLSPTDWQMRLPNEILHIPNTEIVPVPIHETNPSPITTTSDSTIPELSLEKLRLYMLDLINNDRADVNVSPVILGNNKAAQQHAEDMLNNLYYSHWGTDGMSSSMRYTKAGGTGQSFETMYMAGVSWEGGTTAQFEETILSILRQAEITLMEEGGYQTSALSSYSWPLVLLEWNEEVNIGLAFNSEYFFLVLQFETEYINFTQEPTIQNGVLSFSGEKTSKFNLSPSLMVFYHPSVYKLNSNQLNNAPWSGYGRLVALVSTETRTSGMIIFGWPYQDNPYFVPKDTPIRPLGSIIMDTTMTVQNAAYYTNALTWVDKGTNISVSVDLNTIVSRLGAGVYIIRVSGVGFSDGPDELEFGHRVLEYAVFVD